MQKVAVGDTRKKIGIKGNSRCWGYTQQDQYKRRVNQNDPRYYNIKLQFGYLSQYSLQVQKFIGRGGYGVVYQARGTNPKLQMSYALKINYGTVAMELVYCQVAFLYICRGKPNLPDFQNLFICNNRAHILTNYYQHVPFIQLLTSLQLQDVKHYLMALLSGLKSLKEVGIFHRDIKPNNFLFNPKTKTGVIIDFGLAQIDPDHEGKIIYQRNKMLHNQQDTRQIDFLLSQYKKIVVAQGQMGRNKIGTQAYMPLESILHTHNQGYETDIWSVGVIMLQFVLRKFNIFTNIKQNPKIGIKNDFFVYFPIQLAVIKGPEQVISAARACHFLIKFPEGLRKADIQKSYQLQGFDNCGKDLLNRLLELNPLQRITVQQAISHPFFDSIRKQHIKGRNDK